MSFRHFCLSNEKGCTAALAPWNLIPRHVFGEPQSPGFPPITISPDDHLGVQNLKLETGAAQPLAGNNQCDKYSCYEYSSKFAYATVYLFNFVDQD